jgi:hypothetical protein
MQQVYQDAMVICQFYGPPSMFLTFTANPSWDEIQQALPDGVSAADRPDIVARVFQMKKNELIREIKDKKLFGKCFGRFYSIEYQKRGLPHMHLVLFLEDRDRFLDATHIDQIVSAEIPDPVAEKDLHDLVVAHMIHTPCGPLYNVNSPCIGLHSDTGNKYCAKYFPKDATDETIPQEHGYPLYRRRCRHRVTKKVSGAEVEINDTWVVPYNAYLLLQYKAHINVEICRGVDVIKYITKYIYKGPDRTTLNVQLNDEINDYLEARYIGSAEAVWRLQRFPTYP